MHHNSLPWTPLQSALWVHSALPAAAILSALLTCSAGQLTGYIDSQAGWQDSTMTERKGTTSLAADTGQIVTFARQQGIRDR